MAIALTLQARMQLLPKGGYIVDWGGGEQLCCGHKPTPHLGGSEGMPPPPENFGNLDSLRLFLRHSDSYFGAADLVAILALK